MSKNFTLRIEKWKQSLLDLSMRNPLLSLRKNSGIEVLSPKIWEMSQLLHDMEAESVEEESTSFISISPTPLSEEGHVVLALNKSDPSFVSRFKSLKKKMEILSSSNNNESNDGDDGDDELDIILKDGITSETHVSTNKKRKSISTLNDSEKMVLDLYGEKKKTLIVDGLSRAVTDQLTRMERTNRSKEDETGTHVLFLAIGMLEWEDGKSTRVAPLVLMPVSLERARNQGSFSIKKHADEVVFNPALEHMLSQQFGVDWSDVHDALNKDRIDFHQLKQAIINTLSIKELEETVKSIDDDARIVLLSYAKHHMWNDIAQRMDEIKDHHFMKSMLDLESYDDGWSEVSWEELDLTPPDSIYLPLPADASQIRSIMQIDTGVKSLIIEGPPGTGKSQTITNMLAHLLTKGKRVLFVAEKLTALGVVHDKLKELGLGAFCLELHTQNSSKMKILQQLEEAVDARHAPDVPQYKSASDELQETRTKLNESMESLHETYPNGLSIFSAIGYLSRLEKESELTQKLMLNFPNILTESKDEKIQREVLVDKFCLSFSRKDKKSEVFDKWFGEEFDDVAFFSAIRQALSIIHASQRQFSSLKPISHLTPSINKVKTFNLTLLAFMQNSELEDCYKQAAFDEKFVDLISRFKDADIKHQKAWQPFSGYFKKNIIKAPDELWDEYLSIQNQWFLKKSLSMKRWQDKVKRYMKNKNVDGVVWDEWCEEYKLIQSTHNDASSLIRDLSDTFPNNPSPSKMLNSIEKAIKWKDGIENASNKNKKLIDILTGYQSNIGDFEVDKINELASLFASLEDTLSPFKNLIEKQIPSNTPLQHSTLDELSSTLQNLISLQSYWLSWKNYSLNKKEMIDSGLFKVIDMVEDGKISPNQAKNYLLDSYYNSFIHSARMRNTQWIPYLGSNRELVIEKFQEQSEQFEKLTQKYILSQIASRFKNVPLEGRGEMNILKREMMKKTRHMPTRRLIHSLPHILPILKPCLMMSPLSVAEYLSSDVPEFDVVIFDEASQIPIADALGAISRGKQIVIVGDPKQMPPSRMFSGQMDDDWDDDVVLDMDSILTEALGSGVKSVCLNWHYRSRHEQLIAFSNKQYYNGELITFPSIDAFAQNGKNDTSKRGIFVHQIDGVYDRGASATNQAEALAVVDSLIKHLQVPGQTQSIGVVTFNQKQQTLIERLWDEALAKNSHLQKLIDSLDQGVAVKNLENIQGDERDVILFSTTFGKGQDGRMLMNFGPLGQVGGERRFNVAITRARNRMDVFCSFYPHDIDLSRVSHQGIRDLREWLSFAKGESNLIVAAPSMGLPDSPFELSVIEALRNRGWDVVPQVGSSGYRIDIAVLHPKDKSTFLAAIECDGATYHSFKTARDRDRQRQLILEGLGWNVIRIWSTNWFENKEREIERVHQKLNSIIEK